MSEEVAARLAALEEENERLRGINASLNSFIRTNMGSYVADEVLQEIMRHRSGAMIEGERRVVTMMFTDLRNSTELSERIGATDYLRLLNHYLEDMIMIIDSWQGNILEFVGDAIVVVYGAPKPNDDAARNAVGSAVSMQCRMVAVNEWNRKQGYPPIQMGIGIHTGEAILGGVGSSTRMKYDMVGRNVNLASRIEGFTKGGQILVSTETLQAAGDRVVERPEGAMWVNPKGIKGKVLVHDIIGFASRRVPSRG